MAHKVRVAVVGASGYAGAEVVRLLASHPEAEVTSVTSSRNPGRPLREACPWLYTDLVLEAFDCAIDADVFFLCQESGFAGEVAHTLSEKAKVVDLSADFRLTDSAAYESIYKKPWPGSAPYGLPELVDRKELAGARLISNPGCYSTATLLGLMPLIRADLVAGTPVVDGKSGVSGAGRSKTETDYTFSELEGSSKPYAVVGHRHIAEIEAMAGMPVRFTPHLLPVARGMEITLNIPLRGKSSTEELLVLFRTTYKGELFIHIQDAAPSSKQVLGSNSCVISAQFDPRTGYAVVMSVIDNLGKGAAGQAVQNMNVMLGLPEATGLPVHGVWP